MIKRRSRRNGVAFLCSFVAGILYFGSKAARTAVNVRFPFLRDGPVRQDSELTKTRLRAKCGVITTILEVNDAVRYIASNLNVSLIVIGDQRTNHTEWHAFQREHAGVVLYLSPAEQVGLPFRILRHIPWNHFGRKSIGFLYAVTGGCHQIYDFDDDNHLKKPEGFERVSSWAMYELGSTSQTVHVFNPYPYFQPTDDSLVVWPRGFPLQFINDNRTYDVTSDAFDVKRLDGADFENIAVLQSLADHDPDVDAIYRMTRQLPISFQRQKTILIPPRAVYTPWNAQAVLVSNPAFFGLLLPVTVTGRVSDIWRSYITTRLLWETRYRVAFTSPFVTQYRNPHSYIVDFADEDDLYNKVDDLLEALAIWTSDGHDSLETAYIDLITKLVREVEILGETDLRLAKAWVEDLKAIGYVWPAMHERVSAVGCCQKAAIVDQRQVHTFRDLSVNGGNVVNENQTSHSHSPSDENRTISDKRYQTTQTISVSKVERKNAVCIFGISEVNTIPGWKRHVLDQLSADLYVIQDSKNELIQRYAESVGARLFRVNMTLVHFFDKHAPKWNESASGNYLGGLPGPFEKRGAYLLRDRFLCEQHISSHETRAGRKYKFIGLGRADLLWLLPHPKLSPRGCWIPCTNNDWGGLCDHWAWCDRESAQIYALAPLESIPTNVSMNAERHLASVLVAHNVSISRGEAAFVRSCSQNNPICRPLTADVFAKPSGQQIEVAKNLLVREALTRDNNKTETPNAKYETSATPNAIDLHCASGDLRLETSSNTGRILLMVYISHPLAYRKVRFLMNAYRTWFSCVVFVGDSHPCTSRSEHRACTGEPLDDNKYFLDAVKDLSLQRFSDDELIIDGVRIVLARGGGGWLMYNSFMHGLQKLTNVGDISGILFSVDDAIILPDRLRNMNVSEPWISWSSNRSLGCVLLEHDEWLFQCGDNFRQFIEFRHMHEAGARFFNELRNRSNELLVPNWETNLRSLYETRFLNTSTRSVFFQSSNPDIFYIPLEMLQSWKAILRVMYKHELNFDIAIPTASLLVRPSFVPLTTHFLPAEFRSDCIRAIKLHPTYSVYHPCKNQLDTLEFTGLISAQHHRIRQKKHQSTAPDARVLVAKR